MARSTDDFMLTAPSPTTNPFLKWAGGKRQLLSSLRQRYPRGFNKYFEPFLGGGATFFDLCSQERLTDGSATLSDLNGDCIGCYLMVRNRVEDVIDTLTELSVGYRDGAQRHYYLVRDQFNASRQPLRNRSDPLSAGYTPELAAQLIYLNRTGFNGLFRLNARGVFNVPKGSYKNPTICDGDGLRRTASALRRSSVRVVEADFEVTLDAPEPRDFVYCDPPYAPVSETSDFTAWGYPFNRSRPDPQLSRADSRVGAPGSVGVLEWAAGKAAGPEGACVRSGRGS